MAARIAILAADISSAELTMYETPAMATPQADRNPLIFSMNAGLVMHEPFRYRPDDTLGVGMGYAHVSGQLADYDSDVAAYTQITNPGSFGTLLGTPIISQPQSAILGTYAIVKRPWVISDDGGQDAIAIRSIMNLTLTYDHRLVDGAYGAQFLRDLAARLQSWGEADY